MRKIVIAALWSLMAFGVGEFIGCGDDATAPEPNTTKPTVLTHDWSQGFGDSDDQRVIGVATDGSGNVIVAGYFAGTVDFGGGALTSAGNEDDHSRGF